MEPTCLVVSQVLDAQDGVLVQVREVLDLGELRVLLHVRPENISDNAKGVIAWLRKKRPYTSYTASVRESIRLTSLVLRQNVEKLFNCHGPIIRPNLLFRNGLEFSNFLNSATSFNPLDSILCSFHWISSISDKTPNPKHKDGILYQLPSSPNLLIHDCFFTIPKDSSSSFYG